MSLNFAKTAFHKLFTKSQMGKKIPVVKKEKYSNLIKWLYKEVAPMSRFKLKT